MYQDIAQTWDREFCKKQEPDPLSEAPTAAEGQQVNMAALFEMEKKIKKQEKERVKELLNYLEAWTYDIENAEELEMEWQIEMIDEFYRRVKKIWKLEE